MTARDATEPYRWMALVCLLACAASPTAAHAQTTAAKDHAEHAHATDAAAERSRRHRAAVDPRLTSVPRGALLFPWDTVRRRWFLSARADVGFLFIRPRASAGYGIPHQSWSGLDVVPIVSHSQGGVYGGLRARHPRFEIRSGMLYSAAFHRGYLTQKDSYDGRDLELRADRVATFWAWDSEMTVSLPLGLGFLQSETQSLFIFGVPSDMYVFADGMGVVVAPPWAIREQVRYTLRVPGAAGMFLGPAFEAVLVPDRQQRWVLRAGFAARFRLYQDLEVRTDVLPTVFSPDVLGRAGSPWLTINARFFWATN